MPPENTKENSPLLIAVDKYSQGVGDLTLLIKRRARSRPAPANGTLDVQGEVAGRVGNGLTPVELIDEAAAGATVLEADHVAWIDCRAELAGEFGHARGVVGSLDHDLVVVERRGPDGEDPAGVFEPELEWEASQRRRGQV